jgi:hypothetical protein
MSKNTKSVKSVKSEKTVKTVKVGPGRPKYEPLFPRTNKWTFNQFCEVNGINLETGKGPDCSVLTLRKFLKRDMFSNSGRVRSNSLVIDTGELAPPSSDTGLGRKSKLLQLRSKLASKSDSTPVIKKSDTAKEITVNVGTDNTPDVTPDIEPTPIETSNTAEYEAQKAALLGTPLPTPSVTECDTINDSIESTQTDAVTSTVDPISNPETVSTEPIEETIAL